MEWSGDTAEVYSWPYPSGGGSGPRRMNSSILDRLRAFLSPKPSRFPVSESGAGMTTEEQAVLMKALNPTYRVYLRRESGRILEEAWGEGDDEATGDQSHD